MSHTLQSVTIEFKFSAAHRLVHHPGKCNRLHGHNYVAAVTLTADAPDLGETGMVVDFARAKEIICGWVDQEWDHKTVLNAVDPMLWVNESLTDPGTPLDQTVMIRRYGHVPFVMGCEPTAENMAAFLLDRFRDHPDLKPRCRVTRVDLWETDSCCATAEVF